MRYVLDTSALLAFHQAEPEAVSIAEIFEAAGRGDAEVSISFMTIFEVSYLLSARHSAQAAQSVVLEIRALGMSEVWPDDNLLCQAAKLKAQGGLSVADAFIAASALVTDAVLVHVDPEFDRLGPEVRRVNLAADGRGC